MNTLLALALMSTTTQPTPAWLAGDWEPYSNAFIGLRMLSIGKATLSWKGCKNVHFDVLESEGGSVTLRLAPGSTCSLDDEPPTRMDTLRLTLRENHCDLGVTIYASPEAAKKNEPAAEGLYGKPRCPSGPVGQAAANLSTTTR
ncbi:hypothetical protein J2T07_000937 [Luteibacter jiangsuensis]|uniref:Protease inhibitor Inh n=1 Tax=Luteibacter jiangsuensis TaxID=637577 RepID=A0ABT9SUW2_9GAMM|nr:hypothetical protein [Luteibacter jiangsuensis]MDQ0008778.1 hypothetical protein [Luteibacter jiangsuensis]